MGLCASCDVVSVATAKLIHQDGRLQEFSYPVKVSYLLQADPASFICDSDDMDFDDVVSAVGPDAELQPGHLYFALPLTRLRHRILPEEMAALAVIANSALMKSAAAAGVVKHAGSRKIRPSANSACVGEEDTGKGRGGGRLQRGRRRQYTAELSAIPE